MADLGLPDWLLTLIGQGQNNPQAAGPAPGLLASNPTSPLLMGRSASVDTPAVASENDTPATPTPTRPVQAASQPNANVLGTPASVSPTPDAGSGFSLSGLASGLGNAIGGIYGAGGPGDALIALGLSNRTGGKSVDLLNSLGNQQLNKAKLAAFNLQVAQQQAGQQANYQYLVRQGVKPADALSAVASAAGGNDQLLKSFITQNDQSTKYGFQTLPDGRLVAYDKYNPSAVPDPANPGETKGGVIEVAKTAPKAPLTPEQRAQYGIAPDAGPYVYDPVKQEPVPVAMSNDPEAKAKAELLGQISQNFPKSKDAAIGATRTIDAINRQKDALDRGAITGTGAELTTNFRGALAQALGITDPKVIASQEFDAAAKSKAAELAKALSNSGHTTNADLMVGQAMSGGDRSKMEAAVRSVLDANNTLAKETINRHNADVEKYSKLAPKSADVANFYRVDMPDDNKKTPVIRTWNRQKGTFE